MWGKMIDALASHVYKFSENVQARIVQHWPNTPDIGQHVTFVIFSFTFSCVSLVIYAVPFSILFFDNRIKFFAEFVLAISLARVCMCWIGIQVGRKLCNNCYVSLFIQMMMSSACNLLISICVLVTYGFGLYSFYNIMETPMRMGLLFFNTMNILLVIVSFIITIDYVFTVIECIPILRAMQAHNSQSFYAERDVWLLCARECVNNAPCA